jgi:hypothetical protein
VRNLRYRQQRDLQVVKLSRPTLRFRFFRYIAGYFLIAPEVSAGHAKETLSGAHPPVVSLFALFKLGILPTF